MGRNTNLDYDTWAKLATTRYHAAKLRERAIACESEGNETLAIKFMSLADVIDHRCDREQMISAIGGRR